MKYKLNDIVSFPAVMCLFRRRVQYLGVLQGHFRIVYTSKRNLVFLENEIGEKIAVRPREMKKARLEHDKI